MVNITDQSSVILQENHIARTQKKENNNNDLYGIIVEN